MFQPPCRGSCRESGDQFPEGDFPGGEEGVFACAPAQEMRRSGVASVMFAAGPDFVQQEGAGHFRGAVKIVGEAALLTTSGPD